MMILIDDMMIQYDVEDMMVAYDVNVRWGIIITFYDSYLSMYLRIDI
jgi:hypothetical protein